MEELWVVCGLYTEEGATLLAGARLRGKQQNKLVEWKAFIDTVRSADLKNKFLF